MSIFNHSQSPSAFSEESSFPVSESARSPYAPFTSGVGTLIEEEHELLQSIRDQVDHGNGINSVGLQRILSNHVQETQEIIALLERYSKALPIPERFDVLKFGPPRHVHAALPAASGSSLLANLINEHRRLLGHLERLRKSDHDDSMKPGVLSFAAQRHEDMAWMLTALEKEDEVLSDATTAGTDSSKLNISEESWNTDGGQQNLFTPDPLSSR